MELKMCELPEYVHALVDKIARAEGFTEFSVALKAGSNHGDNIMSDLCSAVVSGARVHTNGNCVSGDQLHLLCKLAPLSAARRKEFGSVAMFTREALMYNEVFPLFAKFQQEKELSVNESFCAYPKCYEAIADEATDQFVIIMEDVRPQGFAMWPKSTGTPLEHELLVMEQLGRLHGVSFALKDQQPEKYAELKQQLNDVIMTFFENDSMAMVMRAANDRVIAALDSDVHKQMVQDTSDNIEKYYGDCLLGDVCEPFGVVGHGDCWSNNILYRCKEGTTAVADICLVDWQLSRYHSPTLDILHHVFTSTDQELRQAQYTNLLKRYYSSLSVMVTRLGSDAQKLFTFDDLQRELKRFGLFGFLVGPMMQQIICADPKDIPDLDTYSETYDNSEAKANFVNEFGGETQRRYAERVNGIMSDLVDFGYYWK